MFERKSEVSVPTPWTYPPPPPGHTHLLIAGIPSFPPRRGLVPGIPQKGYGKRDTHPHTPMNRMTDACENITFSQLNKLPYVGHDRLHWILHHDLIVTEQSLKPQVSNNPYRELLFLPNLRSKELR